jgi:hypothetical protein
MNRTSIVALAVLASVAISSADAQTCEGRPGRAAGNVLLGAGFTSGDDATQFSAGVTGLGANVYGGASLGTISYDDFSGSTTTVGGAMGYQLAVGTTGRAQICPWVGADFGFGPKDIEGTGIDASARAISAGLTWGFRASESPDFAMIPTFGAGVVSSELKLTDGVDDFTESETFGQVTLGVGLLFARQFSVKPFVLIPVGLEGANASFGISASLAVGAKR